MTADRRAAGGALPLETILLLCDRILDEVGRRQHIFGWLRPPGAAAGEWLPVDAYYPGRRLVVVCRRESEPHAETFASLVPAHGLRLLQFAPSSLGTDPLAAELALRRMIDELVPPRPAQIEPAQRPGQPAQRPGGPPRSELIAGIFQPRHARIGSRRIGDSPAAQRATRAMARRRAEAQRAEAQRAAGLPERARRGGSAGGPAHRTAVRQQLPLLLAVLVGVILAILIVVVILGM